MNTLTMIRFRPLTLDSVKVIRPLLEKSGSRTCDYTLAGLVMWADYFRYEYAVVDNTLFIKGVTENDVTRPAFSLPVGDLPLERSLAMIKDYCAATGERLVLSAVPEDRLPELYMLGACDIEELTDWADYLYEASDLAELPGKKYNKKRNHIHQFMLANPGYKVEPLTQDNIESVKEFYRQMELPVDGAFVTAEVERGQVFRVLDNYEILPFEGIVLSTPEHGIVAFAIGEVIGDTLYVHIEKMDHRINGAGEMVNMLFASQVFKRGGIRYINREEDVGDEGLRRAKESYHPTAMLKKYNIVYK
ncbi:MAG: phosphatidylglycerol lysyltransferase domain-containing protein [Muribaculum sp.]|nr:phosphatidylglycerol lysyltransferase domain-containing protein [Muribaculum sp.]